jgi:SAM-dependent methyltransferase
MTPYLLQPITCRHVEKSRQGILAAAGAATADGTTAGGAASGRVLVLGAGRCMEIPLPALAEQFAAVTLGDVDADAMQQGVDAAGLSTTQRAKVSLLCVDVTGVTRAALEQIERLPPATDPAAFVDAMAQVLDATVPLPLPLAGRYELVVASCLLSQLHFSLAHGAREQFAQRFPQAVGVLAGSPRWATALASMARRMEERLLDELLRVLAPTGRIYLSESVQVAFITWHPGGQWQTEGTYRMLRSQDLADYLDARFAVEARDRWEWVVPPPQHAGLPGRLFDVQAVVLRAGRL